MIILIILALLGIEIPAGRCPLPFRVGCVKRSSYQCEYVRFEPGDMEFPRMISHLEFELKLACPVGHRAVANKDASGAHCVAIEMDKDGVEWVVERPAL